MKRLFYVDFENVSTAGLSGMLKLTKNDYVKSFFGPKCAKMSLGEAESVFQADVTVQTIKNDQISKNALDFIIMVHLGYDVAKREADRFFIISNDKGYDPAILELKSRTGEVIERYPDIAQALARKEEKTGLFDFLFHKKTPVVENTTEHEFVNKKGKTNGRYNNSQNRGGANRSGSQSNRNGGRNYSQGNRNNGTGTGNRTAQKPAQGRTDVRNPQIRKPQQGTVRVEPKTAVKPEENPKTEPVVRTEVQKPVETVKQTVTRKTVVKTETKKPEFSGAAMDDSYLDSLSIADLRAQLGTRPSKPEQPAQKPASAPAKAAAAKPERKKEPAVMSDAEKDLVNRALAETDNLGDFHNYILKELHDNDRATEIYKSEKHRVGRKNSEG